MSQITTETRKKIVRQHIQAVLVYQLDRFARNRYDSAINKSKLKKNGVQVF